MRTQEYESRNDKHLSYKYDIANYSCVSECLDYTIKYDPDINMTLVDDQAFSPTDPTTSLESGNAFVEGLKIGNKEYWQSAIPIFSPHMLNVIRLTLTDMADYRGANIFETNVISAVFSTWNMVSYKLYEDNFVFWGRSQLESWLSFKSLNTAYDLMDYWEPAHKYQRKLIRHVEIDDFVPDCGESVETQALKTAQLGLTCKRAKEILSPEAYAIFYALHIKLEPVEEIARERNMTTGGVSKSQKRSYETIVGDQKIRTDRNGKISIHSI